MIFLTDKWAERLDKLKTTKVLNKVLIFLIAILTWVLILSYLLSS
jgi:hypothetical protein